MRMLVLSLLKEKVQLPGWTTIEVVSIQSAAVRRGVDRPPEVRVVGEEPPAGEPGNLETSNQLGKVCRLVDRRLGVSAIGLRVLRRQLQAGLLGDAKVTLDKIEEDFQMLRRRLESEGSTVPVAL
jgi:hypothetical protein